MHCSSNHRLASVIAAISIFVSAAHGEEITQQGKTLEQILDAMDVEHLWEPGRSVAWKTGKLLEKQGEFRKSNTHCSAFVAATCLKLDVYILRPPEHETKNLANAQAEWLPGKGRESGWKPVKGDIEAQQMANRGHLVLAAYQEPHAEKNGHIAIVRPSSKSADTIKLEGPQIVQAGATNYNSTSVKEGFKHHAGAFPNGIRYFVHEKKIAVHEK